jgi:hypothetical protein
VITRRHFLQLGAAGLISPSFPPFSPAADSFYIGVIADSHVIDEFYKGPESNPEDTESIFKTTERLTSARAVLNALKPPLDMVFRASRRRTCAAASWASRF